MNTNAHECNVCGAQEFLDGTTEPCDEHSHDDHNEREALDAMAATVICLDCGDNFDAFDGGRCCPCGETWNEEL